MFDFHIEERSVFPIYIQLKNAIKNSIKEGKFPPMKALPQVSQIAEHAGVSLRTADRALQELVNDGICFRRPKKGTFVSPIEQVQTQAVCGILGNFSPQLPGDHPFETLLYCGIMEAAAINNVQTILLNNNSEAVIKQYDNSENFDFKGVLVLDNNSNFDEAKRLAEYFPEKRFMCLNSQREEMPENMYAVVNDDFTGAYNTVKYLASKKYKRFTILSMSLDEGNITYSERCRGFAAAADDFNLEITTHINLRNLPKASQQFLEVYEATDDFLNNEELPEIILCVNDLLAQGALKAIEKNKLGKKVKVAGYDALPLFDTREIITVQVHYAEMGKRALTSLLQLNQNKNIRKIEKIKPGIITIKKGESICID